MAESIRSFTSAITISDVGRIMPTALSGIAPNIDKQLFFEMFLTGQVYLGFARSSPIWGLSTLVHINHGTNDWPAASGHTKDVIYDATNNPNGFQDNNSGGTDKTVYIKRVRQGEDPVTEGEVLNNDIVGFLNVEYMGRLWCRISGLNPLWSPILVDDSTNPPTSFEYYLVRIVDNDIVKYAKIERATTTTSQIYYTPVKLGHSASGVIPTIIYPESDTGALERKINLEGEIIITGLKNTWTPPLTTGKFYITDLSGKILHDELLFSGIVNDDTGTGFRFRRPASGQVSQFDIKIMNNDNVITKLAIYNESLPFFSLNTAQETSVSDKNPPALSLSYAKHPAISKSIFDVLGLIKIQSADVVFSKKLNYFVDESPTYDSLPDEYRDVFSGFDKTYLSVDRVNTPNRGRVKSDIVMNSADYIVIPMHDDHNFNCRVTVDDVVITIADHILINGIDYEIIATDNSVGSSSITVANIGQTDTLLAGTELSSTLSYDKTYFFYATSTDITLALDNGCDSAMIKKTMVSNTVPTDKIYRQMFICYNPKDTDGLPITVDNFSGSNFIPLANNINAYSYDIGRLVYLSNKIPVYRQYLVADNQGNYEKFTIIV